MIKLTERAAEQVKLAVQNRSLPESTMLRVDLQPESGKEQPQLALRLDPNDPRPDDDVEDTQGTRVAVSKNLSAALGNGELDYRQETGGFFFERK